MMLGKYLNRIRRLFDAVDMISVHIAGMESDYRQQALLNHILYDKTPGVTNKKYCSEDVIVSLTSYGRRLYDVCFAIESIMQQTYKPNRIVLWLDKKDFENSLPESLLIQQKRGLDIRVYEPDIRSYKKLIPSLKEFPNAAIITVDDDVMYDFDIVERLIKAYIADPKSVHACRLHEVAFYDDGTIKSYNKWKRGINSIEPYKKYFFTGVGAVIYPPNSFHEDVFKEEMFMEICKTADDVWFNAMVINNGRAIKKVETRSVNGEDYILNHNVQDMGLLHINTEGLCANDIQIRMVNSIYRVW